jgi:hypothetical protein
MPVLSNVNLMMEDDGVGHGVWINSVRIFPSREQKTFRNCTWPPPGSGVCASRKRHIGGDGV